MKLFELAGRIVLEGAKETEQHLDNIDKKGKTAGERMKSFGKGMAIAGTSLVAGFGASLGAVLVTGAKDAIYAEEKIAQLESVLESTGGVAGMTKDELVDLAEGFERTTKFSAESALEAQSLLLTFTKIGSDVFPRATQATADMATAMGTDMAGQSIALGKALNDPIAGVASLTRVGVQFTDEQKSMIESMVEMNDISGAQNIILTELETQFGGSAEAIGNTMGGQIERLQNAFGSVKEELATQFLPILQQLMDWVIVHMPEIKEVLSRSFEVISVSVSKLYGWFNTYLYPILKTIFDWVVKNWSTISAVFETVFGAVGFAIETTVDLVKGLYDGFVDVYNWFNDTFSKAKEIVEDVFDGISDSIENAIGWIEDLIKWAKKAFDALKNIGGNIGDGISNMVGNDVSSGGNVGSRENGGFVEANRAYIVGEKRPELFIPRTDGTIIPDLNGLNGGNDFSTTIYANTTVDASELERILKVNNARIAFELGM